MTQSDGQQYPAGQDPAPYGPQPPYGQAPYAQPQNAQPQYGQASYGQAPYAQPQHDQAPYAQQPYGQTPYGQAPYAQAPYAQPPYGYPYAPPPQRTNGMAIASMVLGILWLYWIGSILALVLGYVAKKQISERGEAGGGMATAGIVLGWIGVGILALVVVVGIAGASLS